MTRALVALILLAGAFTAPAPVLGVRSLLQRAVANLVDNAVKYSPSGGVITIRTGLDGEAPWLSVADQGPGFGDEGGAARGRAAGVEQPESHGMGLTFVRAILRRHGATMTIADAGPGAVVTARFSR